jgi:hypothetical protein
VAITPSKSTTYPFDEVTRVCQTSTLAALHAMHSASVGRPFRFLYMSGTAAERDQSKTPAFKPEYSLMRVRMISPHTPKLTFAFQGETENRVLAFAAAHSDEMQACVAKPGLITRSIASVVFAGGLKLVMGVPSVGLSEVSAAMLHQVVHGFEKEPLENEDLVRIGRQTLDMKAEA